MRYRCCFASGVAHIAFDAGIYRNTTCGSPKLTERNGLMRARWGMPRGAELWEPA